MGLLNDIKKDKNLRRIFGKRELVIIEKQLLGISLKPSEKTRLSRDIRKKFEAIRTLVQFVNEFELKHAAEIKIMIDDAKDVILNSKYFPKIRRILLFGSVVDRQITLTSDIDIAVEFKEIQQKEATRFRLDILRMVSDRIDIQVYNILPDKIKKEINSKGRVLYERENKR